MDLYLWLNIATIVPTFALSWDKKVHFYTAFNRLFPAIFGVGIFFVIWDVIFTEIGVWSFNEKYLTGINVINLPIEEWLFFLTVPYACIFTHYCLEAYFPVKFEKSALRSILIAIGVICILIAFGNTDKMYTMSAFGGAGLVALLNAKNYSNETLSFHRSYIVILVPFLIVNGILTGALTDEPVVIYNNSENLGFRLLTIPVEDVFYNYILLSLTNQLMSNSKSL